MTGTYPCVCDLGDETILYRTERRRSVRRRKCCECARDIIAGDTYEHARGMSCGVWWREDTCLACADLGEWVMRNCGCRSHGDLWRHLVEDVFGDARGSLPAGVWFKVGRWIVQCRDGCGAWGGP